MSRDNAKVILELVLRHCAEQDATLASIRSMCTDEEYSTYKQMIGRSMGEMLLEVINPIIGLYPDLKPPELK